MTAIALTMYSIGMVAFGLRDLLGRIFYALQDTKIPMINGAIAMIINIVINLLLVKKFKHAGLAFATSLSAMICIFLFFKSLKKKIGYFGEDKIVRTTIKSVLSAIVMGIITHTSYVFFSRIVVLGFIGEVISLLLSILIGVIVYCVLIMIQNVEEISIIKNIIYN